MPKKNSRSLILVATIATFVLMASIARGQHAGHHDHAATGSAEPANAAEAFAAVNAKMHKDMAIKPSGDADVDFVRGMIPHHQGAIDMAKVALQYGKDPEIRKLAETIIAAQEGEIAWMKDYLAKKGK